MARKLVTLLLFLFATVQLVLANSHCGKNAWVAFTINSDDGKQTCGDMIITSGKDANSFPTTTALRALSDCAFHNYGCTGSWQGDRWNFCCNKADDRTKGMHGSGNVEFSCSDGPYTCYDFRW
ncbi:hypothetical protein BCR42DRAFT_430389 [Absidia repens]|uniref:Cyanovirin-N domain-containing protein n=1 Tax=Absidia repens TaxID=90262 RepID=A0A1X2HH63_9FUNG|nr:hypothetical protein BCR42DRAFT_430389 [Absidia repens]